MRKTIFHHLRLYLVSAKIELMRKAQYRFNFTVGILANLGWTALSVIFLTALFDNVKSIAGWSFYEMLLLLGVYRLLSGSVSFFFYRSLKNFSQDIRYGRFDFVFFKPVNLQFFLSLRRPYFDEIFTAGVGVALIIFSLSYLALRSSLFQWLLFLVLLLCGFVFFYSFFFMVTTLNFWLLKVDNFRNLVNGIVGVSRFPIEAYGRKTGSFLTFILPLAVIVSFPTKALLGKANFWYFPFALLVALLSLYLSNRFFKFALRYYTSAGG